MSINVSAFIASLGYMIKGWLGIFVVMAIIICAIYGLNKLSDQLEEKMAKKDS